MVADSTMRTGCFTETAFGMLDSDDYSVIFNGTDEGLPLIPYTAHQILAPWPKAMDLVALNPTALGGAVIGLYKNPLNAIKDQRDVLGQLTAKQLIAPPDLTLYDPSGAPLVINPQTLAFSYGGSWLVAETLNGSFVRINLSTLSVTAFAPAYGSQGSPGLLKSRVAVTEDGRFVAIANDVAGEFKVYDLATCDGKADGLKPQACEAYDYHAFASQHISGLRSIRRLWFVNDSLLGFDVLSDGHGADGIYELAPTDSITSLADYVGLGDSYTAGEGAFDYTAGTDSPDNMCHLSHHSYPLLLSRDLFGHGGHSVACSGAVIDDIGSTDGGYKGQVREGESLDRLQQSKPLFLESVESGFLPGYVAQQRFVKRWQPAIVSVSIGGNDIGFGDMLQNCVEPHISRHLSDNTCYNTYEKRLELTNLIDRTVPRWAALYGQLKRESPGTRLYAIGYPQIAVDNGNCGSNVQLNKSELEFANETVNYLNHDIRKAAEGAGVTYVDIGQALKGHRLCEAAGYDLAVNGLTSGGDAGPFGAGILGKESYHPNAFGQELIEQYILKQTHGLSVPIPSGDAGNGTDAADDPAASVSALLDAPKTGSTLYTLVPDDTLAPESGSRGLSVPIRADGARDGLRPNTPYSINLDGPAGQVLGTITSDSSGDIDGKVTVPVGALPGGHTIDVTGGNEGYSPTDVSQPFYVAASDNDADGDGIDNMTDSCPGAISSGQDSDRDGIDDICDGLIAPVGPSSPGGQGSDPYMPAGDGQENTYAHGAISMGGAVHIAPTAAANAEASTSTHVLGAISPNGLNDVDASAEPPAIHSGLDRVLRRRLPWLILPAIVVLLSLATLKFNKKVRFRLQ
jgi:GDSL-like lipase/acylhydrolase family protein